MSHEQNADTPMDAELMEKFLDGVLTDKEAEVFLANFEDSDLLAEQLELQSNIDGSLKRIFNFYSLDVSSIESQIDGRGLASSEPENSLDSKKTSLPSETNPNHSHRSSWIKLAIAALLFIVAGLMLWQSSNWSSTQTAFFKPEPLAKVYSDTVERGFRPYYLCDDDQRFADTFESRHGQPLVLASLPAGSQMLGISYLGGISRTTTAMLCEVDQHKVLVFVDNEENDQREIAIANENPALNVFVTTRGGFVFYEVSPLKTPRMTKYLEFVN